MVFCHFLTNIYILKDSHRINNFIFSKNASFLDNKSFLYLSNIFIMDILYLDNSFTQVLHSENF